MNTIVASDRRPALGIRATPNAPVIIATDGLTQSDGALAVGSIIAGDREAMRVVSVMTSMPIVPDVGAVMTTDIDRTRREQLHRDGLSQATRLYGEPFAVEVHDGDPATAIARLAHASGASLIVCGLGRHAVVDAPAL